MIKSVPGARQSARLPFGRALVAAQLALSLTLVVAAALFVGTLRNLYSANLGFKSDNLLLATLNPKLIGFDEVRTLATYKQIVNDLLTLPSVASVSVMDNPLFSQRAYLTRTKVVGYVPHPGEDLSSPWILHYNVGPHFFATLQMAMVAGRDFTKSDKEKAPPVAVVNEAFVKHYFASKDPIGQKIQLGFDQGEIEIVGGSPQCSLSRYSRQWAGDDLHTTSSGAKQAS